ncbi:hypothetical protein Tco_1480091, partial [Tanacetum coccineum]
EKRVNTPKAAAKQATVIPDLDNAIARFSLSSGFVGEWPQCSTSRDEVLPVSALVGIVSLVTSGSVGEEARRERRQRGHVV